MGLTLPKVPPSPTHLSPSPLCRATTCWNTFIESVPRSLSHISTLLGRFLSRVYLPSRTQPDATEWNIHQSGWTKYHYMPDGSSYSEAVDYPRKDDGSPEELLTFDVETLPNYHPYAIMACAASPSAWYACVSPWLLNESEDPVQLIPLGDPGVPRVKVGHNVSYDRGRTKEEYYLDGTKNRWLDTMALHVAVQCISSNQRPAWMKWRKDRQAEKDMEEEARMAIPLLLQEIETLSMAPETNAEKGRTCGGEEDDVTAKTWESLTSVNSLAEVAALHNVPLTALKSTRDDFMKLPPSAILASLLDYLLIFGQEKWKDNVWLNQLDWTPKVAGKSRGVLPPDPVVEPEVFLVPSSSQLPSWYAHLRESPFSTRSIGRILPLLLKLSYNGQPILWSSKEKWHYLAPTTRTITRFDTAAKNLKTNTVLCAKHALKSFDDGRMGSCDVDRLATLISQGVRDDKLAKKNQVTRRSSLL
ncbi:hypothetical protein B0H11DRAFT_2331988 [Mycena galericulata]|nr:hypothetical protein B0H11DRAFT_2331988 [Mycena galericulata]